MYEDEIDLRIYFDLLLRYRRMIVAVVALAALMTFIVSSFLPPVYEAQAALVVASQRSNMTLTDDFTLSDEAVRQINVSSRTDALMQIAQSMKTARMVIAADPALAEAWEKNPTRMASAIEASAKGDLVVITASAPNAQLAADLANVWMRMAVEQINAVYSTNPDTLGEVNAQMDTAWEEYQQAQKTLESSLLNSRIPALKGQIQSFENSLRLVTQNQQLAGLYVQEGLLQQQLTNAMALKSQLEAGGTSAADAWGTSLAYIALQSQAYGSAVPGQGYGTVVQGAEGAQALPGEIYGGGYTLLQFDLSGSAPDLMPEDVERLIAVLQEKRSLIQEQIDTLVRQTEDGEGAVVSGGLVRDRIETLTRSLTALQAELEQEKAKELQLTQVRDAAWTTYTSLSNKVRELKVEDAVLTSEARQAFEAAPRSKPSGPRRTVNTAVAAALGAVVGVFAAFAVDYLVPAEVRERWGKVWRWLTSASGLPNFDPKRAHPAPETPQA